MGWFLLAVASVVAVLWLTAVTFVLLFLKGCDENDDDHTSS